MCVIKMIKVRHKLVWSAFCSLLLIISNEKKVAGFKISDGHDPNVHFAEKQSGYYQLSINENVPNAILCSITLDDENETVDVDLFNQDSLCGAYKEGYEFKKINSTSIEFHLNKPMDYEQHNCQDFRTYLQNAKLASQTLEIMVGNMDDNAPQLILTNSKCLIHENQVYNKQNSDCFIKMRDEDGLINGTKLSIEKEDDMETLFDVDFVAEPDYKTKETQLVIFLKDGKTLDYETRNLYIPNVLVQEQVTNNSIEIVIDVVDEPDQPPKWLSMFTTKQFEENTDQKFTVKAIDGDVGIKNNITYKIAINGCEKFSCKITLNDEGEMKVTNVDREQVGDTLPLTIEAIEKCAKETEGNKTSLSITFFIQDQNDNVPKIEAPDDKFTFEVEENFIGNIATFSVSDPDLGTNGTYQIKMDVDKGSINFPEAFQVIPVSGYQNGDFTLTVYDSSKLDFEDKDWANIVFKLIAVEKEDESHLDIKTITINLKDVNDESPVFVNESETVNVLESIAKGAEVFNAIATDADKGDTVRYEILGVWGQKLDISENGMISTNQDKVFDFEQVQQVVIQIKASDKINHSTFKALTINVIDVDDEPPTIKIDTKSRISIKENTKVKTEIAAKIVVTDPDTVPKLKVEIDWKKSSITKNSADVDADEGKWQCFDIVEDDHPANATVISAKLIVNEKCSPDFELFDAISVSLIATDQNTEIGDRTAGGSILINIEDVNDNPPEFTKSSITGLQITDGVADVTKIGIISAYDVDLNENITFSIKSLDPNTDWVEIDGTTGQLTVRENVTIDDDVPTRYNVSYKVTAYDNDRVHSTDAQIDIHIVDVNDRTPSISTKKTEISIDEESKSGLSVTSVTAEDLDRDDPFNKLVFKFNTNITNEAANRFVIDEYGKITVDLKNDATLDREGGAGQYVLPIRVYDNPKGTLQLSDNLDLTVILNDINDNPPKIKETSLGCSESLKSGESIGSLEAHDPDEKGPNSQANFEIISVEQVENGKSSKTLSKEFFDISSKDYKIANIILKKNLRDYYGTYTLSIKTWDNGKPTQGYLNKIQLNITMFNFEEPVFKYPSESDKNIVLSKDQSPINLHQKLKLYNNEDLSDFVVDDKQNHKWTITFKILSENQGAPDLFTLDTISNNKTMLQLTRTLTEADSSTTFELVIEASVKSDKKKDEAQTSVHANLKIAFFSVDDEPTFDVPSKITNFEEDNPTLTYEIPPATYAAKIDFNITPCYFLMNEADTFKVDINTGTVSLQKELDYETENYYQLKIAASSKNSPPTDPHPESIFQLEINVDDINEFEPVFFPSKFYGAYLKSSAKGATITIVNATDEDGTGTGNLKYSLSDDPNDVKCDKRIKFDGTPFKITPNDGKISSLFSVTSDMSGFCIFNVYVTDKEDKHGNVHTQTTTVQINIISDDELVMFTFINSDWEVTSQQDKISSTIDKILKKYKYESYLADFTFNGEYKNTTANFFFLHDNTPVKASEILGNLTSLDNFNTLKKELASINIHLYDFSVDNSTKQVEDYLKIWLIVTTCILATLLMLLIVIFFFRHRALTRRIKNLSTTKFGSQESGLNRAGVAAPTTNRNAIEGSNPIFNFENFIKEVEPEDRNSIISSDSDLFGVEENPEFQA